MGFGAEGLGPTWETVDSANLETLTTSLAVIVSRCPTGWLHG